jgi:3',5'-cyclic-AMP phosphodiesterase
MRMIILIVLGIDSLEPDIDDGHIGRGTHTTIQERLNSRNKIKMLALHHHLIPILGTGREKDIPVDAADVLKLCVESEVNFILSGHKHMPWVWKLEESHFITAGTSTTRQLKGRGNPSFNLIDIDIDRICIKEVDVKNESLNETLNVEQVLRQELVV